VIFSVDGAEFVLTLFGYAGSSINSPAPRAKADVLIASRRLRIFLLMLDLQVITLLHRVLPEKAVSTKGHTERKAIQTFV